MPSKFSRVTPFRRSSIFCTILKRGKTSDTTMLIVVNKITTATAVAVLHCQFLFAILIIAQIAVIGARTSICAPIETNIWICITSLVVRVIRLLVENSVTSSISMSSTLWKSSDRKFIESRDASFEIKYPTMHDAMSAPNAQSNIMLPFSKISDISLPSVCTSFVISDM